MPPPLDPPPPAKAWQHWILVAIALGAPLAALQTFSGWAANHPWQAATLTIAYEAILFLASLARGIWKRLENPLLDKCAQWLDFQIQCLAAGYRRKYLRHLTAECHDLDVKGLTTQGTHALALRRVFVELEIEPTPAASVSSEPAPQLPERFEGRHALWDYLQAGTNLAVIGGPGSGKTTLLRHACLLVSEGHRSIRRLPVLLFLRNHTSSITANPDFTLTEAIEQGEIVREQEDRPPNGWWDQQIRQDRCLILFDGLDEVAGLEARRRVADWVDRVMRRHAGNLFVTTSRPGGYRDNPLSGVTVLGVCPFTPAQIRSFVDNWYLANELAARNLNDHRAAELARHNAARGARDLQNRLASSHSLSELAVNPLLLTMIATVHKFRSELPGRRVELYREICDVFLGKRHAVRGVDDPAGLTPQQKQAVLEPLAFAMMAAGLREFSLHETIAEIRATLAEVNPHLDPPAFLRMIEDSSGLLVEAEAGVYRFAHKTFQEYLAAVHVRNSRRIGELTPYVHDDWWHETIRLYCAESDATPVLQACLDHAGESLEALVLAHECLEEAKTVKPEWRERVQSLLREGLEDPARWRFCAQALLTLRLRRFLPLTEHTEIDPGLVTYAEYQLFLEDTGKPEHRPLHWPDTQKRFTPGTAMQPVAGVDTGQIHAFCEYLSGPFMVPRRYRLPTGEESAGCDPSPVGWWTANGHDIAIAGAPAFTVNVDSEFEHLVSAVNLASTFEFARSPSHDVRRALEISSGLHHDRHRVFAFPRLPHASQALVELVVQAANLPPDTGRLTPLQAKLADHLSERFGVPREHCVRAVTLLNAAYERATRRDPYWVLKQLRDSTFLQGAELAADAFVQFALTQARRDGRLPVLGGIRLVRERLNQ